MSNQIVRLLNSEDFQELHRKNSRDFKNAPTPAITLLGQTDKGVGIRMVAIDEGFLPIGDKAQSYLQCLATHELSEAEFILRDLDKLRQTVEDSKNGRPVSPEPHLYALKKEMEKAEELGIFEEYNDHWNKWLKNKISDITDEKAKEAAIERLVWRTEAAKNVGLEKKIQENYKGMVLR